MSIFKRAMEYLGLGEDDAYDDYDDGEVVDRSGGLARGGDPRRADVDDFARPVARQVTPRDTDPVPPARRYGVDDSSVQPRPMSGRTGSTVRTIGGPAAQGEPYTVKAIRFNDIQEVANRFRDGHPVILNTEGCDAEVARRMVDFSSGLCYGLHGKIEKVAKGVYLLKPAARPAADY
ncbi:MAG: cell division protein SepF [Actinomycetota bacterium]